MSDAYLPSIPAPSQTWSAFWGLRVASTVQQLVQKANNTAELTLTASATATVMTDARLSAFSVLSFMPKTANAAFVAADIYVTDQKKGQATINHASTVFTDQTFGIARNG